MPNSVLEADGVEFTVTASSRDIDVGEPLHVEVTVLADADVDVAWPEFGEKLGSFEIRSAMRTPPIPVEGCAKKKWQIQLELMTFEEGTLEVPAIEINYSEKGSRNEASAAQTLASEPLTIAVHSVVGADADPTAFRDIKGAAEMPTEPAWKLWMLVAGIAVLLVIAVLAALLFWRMRREPAVELPLAPHEWALRELAAIERERFIEQRAFETFYVRLSAVVRGYVERRFGLMAPERTTEEFLREARGSRLLRDDHRELLGDFLRAADMVKFARFEPMERDCNEALASARSFIEQTAPEMDKSTSQQVNKSTRESAYASNPAG